MALEDITTQNTGKAGLAGFLGFGIPAAIYGTYSAAKSTVCLPQYFSASQAGSLANYVYNGISTAAGKAGGAALYGLTKGLVWGLFGLLAGIFIYALYSIFKKKK